MILRFLNVQGIAGIAVSFALAILLVIQKGETRHWRKQSAGFEQRYHQEQAAFAGTVANVRAAADAARAADRANATRVATAQRAINERTADDFKTRIALARAGAERLRVEPRSRSRSRCWRKRASARPIRCRRQELLKPPVKTDFLPPTR